MVVAFFSPGCQPQHTERDGVWEINNLVNLSAIITFKSPKLEGSSPKQPPWEPWPQEPQLGEQDQDEAVAVPAGALTFLL